MPLGSRWAVQESCLLAGEIDAAVTAAERENRRGLRGYIYSSTSVNVPPAGGGYSLLAPKDC